MQNNIYDRFTILENPNWKDTFKKGQIFIRDYDEKLQGYFICGIIDKNKLLNTFILKEDIDKCNVINDSEILNNYILKMKGE